MPTVKEVIKELKRNYHSEDHIAIDIWTLEDLVDMAFDLGFNMDEKIGEEILQRLHSHVDSEQGLAYNVVESMMFDYLDSTE